MKISNRYLILLVVLYCTMNFSAHGQIDTIRLQDKRLNASVLKPGLNQYLVYFQDPKKKTTLRFSLWLRDIQLKDRNGEKVFTITQHWFGNDTTSYRYVYSINKAVDFTPIYHSETIGTKTKAYNWGADKITGADSVTQNLQKSFSLDFKLPNFNWNLDIETFEMLPLAEGKTFVINFYDAGLDPPAYVNYKVIGSEVIQTMNNEKVDCWKLTTEGDYKGNKYSETYWISKKSHEFLKEEDSFNGIYRYKIKMPTNAPDLMERFVK
ncbi:MAG TPA: hypothetical protein VK671_04395 [Mucilaginibacter sp.]|jgi:hypothetical protein|nr:hypothetical protein [Mucilaginibacter sp.]